MIDVVGLGGNRPPLSPPKLWCLITYEEFIQCVLRLFSFSAVGGLRHLPLLPPPSPCFSVGIAERTKIQLWLHSAVVLVVPKRIVARDCVFIKKWFHALTYGLGLHPIRARWAQQETREGEKRKAFAVQVFFVFVSSFSFHVFTSSFFKLWSFLSLQPLSTQFQLLFLSSSLARSVSVSCVGCTCVCV